MFWRFATKMSGFESVMYATVYKLLYYLNIGICWLVDLFYNIFDKLAGLCKATYDGDADVLSGLLFSNGAISTVFWCMAILCVVLALGFVFVVMARRASEFETMVVRTNKEIMRGFGKTAVIVLSMTLVFVLIFNATGLLMQQAQYAWIDADDAQGIGEGVRQNLRAVAGAASHIEQLAGLFKADAFDQIDGRLRPFGLEAEIGCGIPLHGVPLAG